MGLGFHYAHPLGENAMLQFYFAPVGDPALGPVAFPHRASADELPQATLSHHWQDSTHIADEVITAGIMLHNMVRLEASGFYGTEPGENRWIIRLWPHQFLGHAFVVFSLRRIGWRKFRWGESPSPERQEPGDVVRATASLHYTRPMQGSSWSTSLIWGRNHEMIDHRNLNSYLLESVAPYRRKNFFTGRIELVDKDELFSDQPDLEAQLDAHCGIHVSDWRLHRRIHARHRHVPQSGDRNWSELYNLLHARCDQALLREPSGFGQHVPALAA